MKNPVLTALALSLLIVFGLAGIRLNEGSRSGKDQTINPIIGDISFFESFGNAPSEMENDLLRIQTHLRYVEKSLRSRDRSDLTEAQREQRIRLLDHLKDYWQAGVFPINSRFEGRRPCFIDEYGNVCAVGYLVEQSAGREEAERINDAFQYAYVKDMEDENLFAWANENGFELEELAMIQPSYGFWDYPVNTRQAVASASLNGLSVGASFAAALSRNPNSGIAASSIGLGTGLASLGMGIWQVNSSDAFGNISSDDGMAKMGLANIGIGTATTIFNSFMLHRSIQRKKQAPRTSLGPMIYDQPMASGNAYGLQFSYRF